VTFVTDTILANQYSHPAGLDLGGDYVIAPASGRATGLERKFQVQLYSCSGLYGACHRGCQRNLYASTREWIWRHAIRRSLAPDVDLRDEAQLGNNSKAVGGTQPTALPSSPNWQRGSLQSSHRSDRKVILGFRGPVGRLTHHGRTNSKAVGDR